MAYTKTEWKKDDVISSAGLNKIENELEALEEQLSNLQPLICTTSVQNEETEEETIVLNQNYKTIKEAFLNNRPIYLFEKHYYQDEEENEMLQRNPLIKCEKIDSQYSVMFYNGEYQAVTDQAFMKKAKYV